MGMDQIHIVLAAGVVAASFVAAIWGAVLWVANRQGIGFWYTLRVMQTLVVLQVVAGGVLLLTGHEPADSMHILYGVLPLVVSLVSEGVRSGGAHRELGEARFADLDEATQVEVAVRVARFETGVMALGSLVILGLAVRAAMTGGGLS